MSNRISIEGQQIGEGKPVYFIAEMSANHAKDLTHAKEIVHAAKETGANAVKLQTYTPDTLTIDCKNQYFRIGKRSIWKGESLYSLYEKAYMPWKRQPHLKTEAEKIGITIFSTPFDDSAVDFLEELKMPAYKIASFELVDIPLLQKVAATRKPVILSTGMATLGEIDEAVQTLQSFGTREICLLKCTSAYPAPPEDANLKTLPHMKDTFGFPVGLSDHTLGIEVPIAAAALGASVIEKHFTLSRAEEGPDSSFSLEPDEFHQMVKAVRNVESAIGQVSYQPSVREAESKIFRKSLFIIEDIKTGENFTPKNLRNIRPGYGLPPKHLERVLGRKALLDIRRGTPLDWKMVGE